MQCVCGYAHYNDWEINNMIQDETPYEQGYSEFLMMTAVQTFDNKNNNYYTSSLDTYTVYACPKCGTLKINV
jgi:hypothetical protein